jgi:hypothetical protein
LRFLFPGAGHSKYINNERFKKGLRQRTVRLVRLVACVAPAPASALHARRLRMMRLSDARQWVVDFRQVRRKAEVIRDE